MAKSTKQTKTGLATQKIDEITEIKEEIKEIKNILEEMTATLKKLLDVLPFKK